MGILEGYRAQQQNNRMEKIMENAWRQGLSVGLWV